MSVYDDLISGETSLSLVGLGYVGLPIAVAFSSKVRVVGYDLNEGKVARLGRGEDPTNEVGDKAVRDCSVTFTSDEKLLQDCSFHIVAVPTPVGSDHNPDLGAVKSASATVGRNLRKGSIVVYESTVYPGVTEDVCVPILEKESGLTCGRDFKVGYSPERINPGDKEHRLNTITKIVSGMDAETLEEVANVYSLVIDAGVYRAESIKVAEAAKVIENSQRDINIAFMNELSIIFDRLGIDTLSVLKAAGTKWNFLNFRPGLVGGHCIGVDPYYLTYRAEQVGYHSQVILSGRRINDDMGRYVASKCVKLMASRGVGATGSRVGVLGFTFKENCPDTRNTRVIEIVDELKSFGAEPVVCDPYADADEASALYGIDLVPIDQLGQLDALVVATAHEGFAGIGPDELERLLEPSSSCVIVDVKGVLEKGSIEAAGYAYWRL